MTRSPKRQARIALGMAGCALLIWSTLAVSVVSLSELSPLLYGFGYVRELELLQEAGFNPIEVLRAATSHGAGLLGIEDLTGSIEVGKRADILVHDSNPLDEFKLLYEEQGHRDSMRSSNKADGSGACAIPSRTAWCLIAKNSWRT